jgi:hypothetical protein
MCGDCVVGFGRYGAEKHLMSICKRVVRRGGGEAGVHKDGWRKLDVKQRVWGGGVRNIPQHGDYALGCCRLVAALGKLPF